MSMKYIKEEDITGKTKDLSYLGIPAINSLVSTNSNVYLKSDCSNACIITDLGLKKDIVIGYYKPLRDTASEHNSSFPEANPSLPESKKGFIDFANFLIHKWYIKLGKIPKEEVVNSYEIY